MRLKLRRGSRAVPPDDERGSGSPGQMQSFDQLVVGITCVGKVDSHFFDGFIVGPRRWYFVVGADDHASTQGGWPDKLCRRDRQHHWFSRLRRLWLGFRCWSSVRLGGLVGCGRWRVAGQGALLDLAHTGVVSAAMSAGDLARCHGSSLPGERVFSPVFGSVDVLVRSESMVGLSGFVSR